MKATKSNPFFTVSREELYRKNTTNKPENGKMIYTGYDSLYRKDNGRQLAVVSKQYEVITHREAVDTAHHALRDVGIMNFKFESEVSYSGAQLFHKIQFPEYKFNLDDNNGKSLRGTALDSGSKLGEGAVPQIVVKNTYDGTSSLNFTYGIFRLVCSNGMMVGTQVDKIAVTHSGEIDFESIGDRIIENLEATIEGAKRSYQKLNAEDGFDLFKQIMITDAWLSNRYNNLVFDMLEKQVTVEWDKDEETDKLVPVDARLKQEFSKYALWCVLTEVVTHRIHSAQHRDRLSRKIAKSFTA